jgi:hypothetical protein
MVRYSFQSGKESTREGLWQAKDQPMEVSAVVTAEDIGYSMRIITGISNGIRKVWVTTSRACEAMATIKYVRKWVSRNRV